MMEGILKKEQLAKVPSNVPSKTKDAKLKIVGGDFILILTQVVFNDLLCSQ